MKDHHLNRRDFLKSTSALGAAAMMPQSLMAADANEAERPNIVLIMADDLGWQELGCMGQKKIKTPHVDRLAEQGMRFTQFYAGCAVCAPSRCSLLTGKHGGHAAIRDNCKIKDKDGVFGGQLPLPESEPSIAETLKVAGYRTGCFGKWGLGAVGTSGDPLNQGFDLFYGYNCQRHAHNLYPRYLVNDRENEPLQGNTRGLTGDIYAPERIADEMLEFVRDNADKPFFLYYTTVLPHLPLQVPDDDLEQYEGLWPETPYEGKAYQKHPTPRACYASMISFLDKQVGRLVALLDELGLGRNTVVLFTSDNGTTHMKRQVDYEFFESVGPLRGLKGSLYEGGIRVPLIVRWPGRIQPASTSDHIAANYDLPATLAEIAGIGPAKDTDGISFYPTLTDNKEQQQPHAYLFWDFAGYHGQLAVRMGRWKGIKRNLRERSDAPLELLDLEEDIGENNDVAELHPEIAEEIERVMLRERTLPSVEAFRFGTYPKG